MFDPYRKWLSIPESQIPPNHYQLLGISPDERDVEVIREAEMMRTAHVRTFQAGAHSELCAKLLTEIAAAAETLTDSRRRAAYDAQLEQKRNLVLATPPPIPATETMSAELTQRGGRRSGTHPVAEVEDAAPKPGKRKKRKGEEPFPIAALFGGLGTIAVVIVGAVIFFRSKGPEGNAGAETTSAKVEAGSESAPDGETQGETGEFPNEFPIRIQGINAKRAMTRWEGLCKRADALADMSVDLAPVLAAQNYSTAPELQAQIDKAKLAASGPTQARIQLLSAWLNQIRKVHPDGPQAEGISELTKQLGMLSDKVRNVAVSDPKAQQELAFLRAAEGYMKASKSAVAPAHLERARVAVSASTPKLQTVGALVLIAAGDAEGIDASARLFTSTLPEAQKIQLANALIRSENPAARNAAVDAIKSNPALLTTLTRNQNDAKVLVASVKNHGQDWRPVAEELLKATDLDTARDVLDVIASNPPSGLGKKMIEVCGRGSLRDEWDFVASTILLAKWIEAYDAVSTILATHPGLPLDEVDVEALEACRERNKRVARDLVLHLIVYGTPPQVAWCIDAFGQGDLPIQLSDLVTQLKRDEARSGSGHLVASLLERPDDKSLDLAAAILTDVKNLEGSEIDIEKLHPNARKKPQLMETLYEVKWNGDAVGKGWVLQEVLGKEVIDLWIKAEARRDYLVKLEKSMNAIWESRKNGVVKGVLKSKMDDFTRLNADGTPSQPDIREFAKQFTAVSQAGKLGPVTQRIGAIRKHVQLLSDLDATSDSLSFQTRFVVESSPVGRKEYSLDPKDDKEVTAALARLLTLSSEFEKSDAAIGELVATIPGFANADADEPAAEDQAKDAAAPKASPANASPARKGFVVNCTKCGNRGKIPCNYGPDGKMRCRTCGGDGRVSVRTSSTTGSLVEASQTTMRRVACRNCRNGRVDCPYCDKNGMRQCPSCRGRSAMGGSAR